ncbi:hypothetical protein UFOVP723_138 [uncultured Caudovirales phage]|jgi:hypothetical protein|uniref:Uncharacterized protein n=1 Tax=uncultured Caudovirales phage TaxID=2100421 RepID=A0A6J5NN43_9CAUD|nr:hypothetical protein UFOVP723_138 [uncultured Caudovirales phage]
MANARFIAINTSDKNKETVLKFVNVDHIQQIYQVGSDIVLELTDYTKLTVINQNIHVFMDRFK